MSFTTFMCFMSKALRSALVLIGLTLAQGVRARGNLDLLRFESSDEIMGTTFSVVLYGSEMAMMKSAAGAALEEAHRLDRLLSNYLPDSAWSAINRSAAATPVALSAELFDLLSACADYSRRSDGAFDITVGPLMKAWGFFKGEGFVPESRVIDDARARVGYRHVVLDASRHTVRFDRAGVELDPGGIGKGYAVDRMVDVLKRRGISRAFVSASGSSIYGLGAPPDRPEGWAVPIRAPWDPAAAATTVYLKNLSISTSGRAEKFFRADGRVYSHIMDPRTGYPAQGTVSVSVIAPMTIDSEAWTKPYFINGRAWTSSHVPVGWRVYLCGQDARSCDWIPR